MVVLFPDQGIRTVTAVIDSHRRLLRLASDEGRRRARIEPPDPRGGVRPRVAAGPHLAIGTARIGLAAVNGR